MLFRSVDVCGRRVLLGSYSLPVPSSGPGRGKSRYVRSKDFFLAGHGNRGIAMAAVPDTSNTIVAALRFPLQGSMSKRELDPRFIACQHCRVRGQRHVVCPRPASTKHPVETLTRDRAAPPPQNKRGTRHFQVIPDVWLRRRRSRPSTTRNAVRR